MMSLNYSIVDYSQKHLYIGVEPVQRSVTVLLVVINGIHKNIKRFKLLQL